MKKIALLFSIACVSQLYGMEWLYEYRTSVVTDLSSYSYIPSWFQSPKEPEYIQILHKDKNEFERRLIPGIWAKNLWISDLISNPEDVLRYCYYTNRIIHKHHQDHPIKFLDSLAVDIIKKFQEAKINDYSAIGAAILAPKISIQNKRCFIKKLMELGCELTKKDIMLAELMLYDAIPANKKTEIIAFLTFLSRKDIPKDVRKEIVGCMVNLYREKYWPLPHIANEK